MNSINGDTIVEIKLKHITWYSLGAAIVFCGGIYALHGFLAGDISSLRVSVDSANERTHQARDAARNGDDELRKEISTLIAEMRNNAKGLRQNNAALSDTSATLAGLAGEMATLSDSVQGLNGTVATINGRLTDSIKRQQAFEEAVLFYLVPAGDAQGIYKVPEDWQETQDTLYKNVLERGNPVTNWLNISSESK
ncbi:hypothetical protein [Roseibium sp.]|uniref:hypothetical protein n=1 Tax=Roseibium sp. TaxID=1936156 RepID=UPI003B5255D9